MGKDAARRVAQKTAKVQGPYHVFRVKDRSYIGIFNTMADIGIQICAKHQNVSRAVTTSTATVRGHIIRTDFDQGMKDVSGWKKSI